MKFDKIQQEILKAAFKRDETHNEKCFQWLHFETDDNVCVVDHGVAIYIIPKKHWYLDIEKVFEKPPVQLEALMKEENDAEDVTDLMTERQTPDKKMVRIFKIDKEDSPEIWIDSKILKVFDLDWCTFKGKKHNTPLFIYENGELAGVVLPVAHPVM